MVALNLKNTHHVHEEISENQESFLLQRILISCLSNRLRKNLNQALPPESISVYTTVRRPEGHPIIALKSLPLAESGDADVKA
ncbi:hypothetical protein [Klebsiella sp. BIGb0407]|uniref:hypothetical protein n=1 Tax=Klebsiella sp. BIGb0407 TaxID=2940603 RepID=UPI00216A4D82|nr:hypothetical protein [Klebsiella sp. BIGb0407]MCS3432002.1 hypothetical protein [Klebsiella sp. BIGb0407]